MSGKNVFGGGNPNSIYVPMTETEQEVLHRLVNSQDLQVKILGWGFLEAPPITLGDARIGIVLDLQFSKPQEPVLVKFFDLELRTQAGLLLRKERLPIQAGAGMLIGAGVHLIFSWDIMIHHLSPELVKMIKPGAIGLTSRRLDKDTGEATLKGNMQTTVEQEKLLKLLAKGEAEVKRQDAVIVHRVTREAGYEIKKTRQGYLTPDVS